MDLLIQNAHLMDRETLVHIGINNNQLTSIIPVNTDHPIHAKKIINANGNLVLPPFVDSHIHLDAALSSRISRENRSGTLSEAITIWHDVKQSLRKKDIKKHARTVAKWLLENGCGYIRAHTDCGEGNFILLEALQEVKAEMADLIHIQIVAFPQEGIFSSEKNKNIFQSSVQMGVDVIGGLPQAEPSVEKGSESLQFMFQLAEKYNLPIDIHADESIDPSMRFTEEIAKLTIAYGMQGKVTSSHATAMHVYDDTYIKGLYDLLIKAEMNIVTNPTSNSLLQGRGPYPRYRGITRVDELIQNGINVSIGNDNVMDPFGPFGNGNLLQTAWLLAHIGHLSNQHEVNNLLQMITNAGAKTLGIQNEYGIEIGKPANLVILHATSVHDAIRRSPEVLYVIKNGTIVATTTPSSSTIHHKNDLF